MFMILSFMGCERTPNSENGSAKNCSCEISLFAPGIGFLFLFF
jgi:hypothetical protein